MSVLERNVEKVLEKIQTEEEDVDLASLERLKYRLSDAIREGASVAPQAFSWEGPGDSMCALSAAVTAAKARKYL